MPAKPSNEFSAATDERANLAAAIRGGVLSALGRPADLFRIAVLPLWAEHYRVNILTGPDAATAKVANSFFVVVDGRGTIVRSIPAIVRQY
jgi:hypothetical protein